MMSMENKHKYHIFMIRKCLENINQKIIVRTVSLPLPGVGAAGNIGLSSCDGVPTITMWIMNKCNFNIQHVNTRLWVDGGSGATSWVGHLFRCNTLSNQNDLLLGPFICIVSEWFTKGMKMTWYFTRHFLQWIIISNWFPWFYFNAT